MDDERASKRVKAEEPTHEPSPSRADIDKKADVGDDSGICLTSPEKQEELAEEAEEEMSDDEPSKIERLAPNPVGEVRNWIESAATPEKETARFLAFVRCLWPSNDEFVSVRHPFYDPREYDRYSDFVRWELYDGFSPYDDDDYDPSKDPDRSTEVWQPKIGDEGIENEEDLRVILDARAAHRERVAYFEERRNRFMTQQRNAGVRYADMDMKQIFFVRPDSDDDEEDADASDEEDDNAKTTANKIKLKVKANPSTSAAPATQATGAIDVNVALVTPTGKGNDQTTPARRRGRPLGSKNKKSKRGTNKRKRDVNDADYRDDDTPTRKRSSKKRKLANDSAEENADDDAAGDDVEWRAQTRSAARRKGAGGDGVVDVDGDTDMDTDSDSDSGSDTDTETEDPSSNANATNGHITNNNMTNGKTTNGKTTKGPEPEPEQVPDNGSSSVKSGFISVWDEWVNTDYTPGEGNTFSSPEELQQELEDVVRLEEEMRRKDPVGTERWLAYLAGW